MNFILYSYSNGQSFGTLETNYAKEDT
jgi:hypothetical protein